MTKTTKLVLPLLLVACAATAQDATLAPEGAVPPVESGPVTRQTANRESPLLDFEYSWPQAISPDAQLVARLSDDLSKTYDEALASARENKVDTQKYNAPFHQNTFTRTWTLEGRSDRLISLVANTDTYTGGAHPNHTSAALLWDVTSSSEVKLADLFSSPDGLESAVRAQFCKLLDEERAKRRQGEKLEGDFAECPAFSELTIAPAGKEGSGTFDSILLIADPYVAGPYAEGDYEVRVAVTPALISALKPEYRAGFKP